MPQIAGAFAFSFNLQAKRYAIGVSKFEVAQQIVMWPAISSAKDFAALLSTEDVGPFWVAS